MKNSIIKQSPTKMRMGKCERAKKKHNMVKENKIQAENHAAEGDARRVTTEKQK